jgi:hypothetical protein
MVKAKFIKHLSLVNILSMLLVMIAPFLTFQKAQAVAFSEVQIRFDRIASNTATTGMICAKTSSTLTTYRKLEVIFPDENSATDFAVTATAANWQAGNLSTSDIDGNTAWPDIANATASFSGNTVTWTHTADQTLNSANTYCFRWTNTSTLTTPTTAGASNLVGTVRALNSSDGELMNSKYATAIVSNDQIAVTATVTPTFTFALSGNLAPFGTLTTSAGGSSATSRTTTIGTNAANGWVTWVKSANAALTGTAGSVATAGTVNNAPEDLDSVTGYVLDVDITSEGSVGDGDVTQASNWGAEYNGVDATQGGSLATTFQPIAASDGTSDADVLTLIPRARITAVQAAGTDYTDTLTVVAAGRF